MIGGDGETQRMMDLDGRGSVVVSRGVSLGGGGRSLVIDHQWRSSNYYVWIRVDSGSLIDT
jgi:hypothetical protein